MTRSLFSLSIKTEPARLAAMRILFADAFFSLVAGAVVALPWNATIRSLLRAQSPDATVFRDDPIELVELVTGPSGQTPLLVGLIATLSVVWLLSYLPFGAVLSSINTRKADEDKKRGALKWHFSHAAFRFSSTVSTGAIFGLARIMWFAMAAGCAAAAHEVLRSGNNDARTSVITAAVFLVVSLGVIPLSALEDCVHVARYRGEPSPFGTAARTLRANMGRLCASLVLRYALALLLMVLGLLALRGSFATRAALVFAVHQVFFLARAMVRAWWLAVASQCVARSPAGKSEVPVLVDEADWRSATP